MLLCLPQVSSISFQYEFYLTLSICKSNKYMVRVYGKVKYIYLETSILQGTSFKHPVTVF